MAQPEVLEGWGEKPLRARVRVIEPYAFTKVSALGVEERRTNVVLDFVDAPGALGDGYRVIGKVITWEAPSRVEGARQRAVSLWPRVVCSWWTAIEPDVGN